MALLLIAYKTPLQDIHELTELFLAADRHRNGLVSLEQFRLDIDRNGIISYTEFIAAMLETQGRIDEERITEAFEVLDSDHSGEITRSNIQELETERGCAVSKEEFLDLFRKKKMD
eukprot:4073582-Ditylum_brightwellii.AAC.1